MPVSDVGALRSDDPAGLRALAAEVGRAAHAIGFFSIVNHGVPKTLIDAMFKQSERGLRRSRRRDGSTKSTL